MSVNEDLDHEQGTLTSFPSHVEHLKAKLHVTEDHVDLIHAGVVKGDSSFDVDGVVNFGKDKPIDPQIHLAAQNIPIDRNLLAALPSDRREWLTKIGAGGKIDVDGWIVREAGSGQLTIGSKKPEDDISYDMSLTLKEGSFWPVDGTLAASAVNGTMRLMPTSLEVYKMQGKRGLSDLFGSGKIAWPA